MTGKLANERPYFVTKRGIYGVARPTGIEPVLRVPETLVISFSLRAREEVSYHRVMVQSTRVPLATALAMRVIS
jgi:hypothetical protein